MLAKNATGKWQNGTRKEPLTQLHSLEGQLRRSKHSLSEVVEMAKPALCDVEESKAEKALAAIEDAVNTLRAVLDEVIDDEENGNAGTD